MSKILNTHNNKFDGYVLVGRSNLAHGVTGSIWHLCISLTAIKLLICYFVWKYNFWLQNKEKSFILENGVF